MDIYSSKHYDELWFKLTVIPIWEITRFCRSTKMWIYYRILPKHQYHIIRTGLKPGYYDQDTLMLYGCMVLLERFVNCHGGAAKLDRFSQELLDSTEEWGVEKGDKQLEYQANYQREAAAIYRWWKDRPNREKEIDNELENCGKNYNRYDDLVHKLAEEDQEMLHRLIDIRPNLWT